MPEIFSASKKKKDLPLQEKYPLSSFLMWPNGVNFETRESEEKIMLDTYKPVHSLPILPCAAVENKDTTDFSLFILGHMVYGVQTARPLRGICPF